MTDVQRVTVYLFVLVCVWAAYQQFVRMAKCSYCGRINGHDDGCPYNL